MTNLLQLMATRQLLLKNLEFSLEHKTSGSYTPKVWTLFKKKIFLSKEAVSEDCGLIPERIVSVQSSWFFNTFVIIIIKTLYKVPETPIWVNKFNATSYCICFLRKSRESRKIWNYISVQSQQFWINEDCFSLDKK